MSYRVLIKPEAEADLEAATLWYNQQHENLGESFLDSVNTTIERIQQNPEGYPIIYKNIRSAMTKKFPYLVLFEFNVSRVAVLGIIHGHRNPEIWKLRSAGQN
ncbi:MAG: hypothetical protein Tsb009_34650 [Planctomycetaceae bacterium]